MKDCYKNWQYPNPNFYNMMNMDIHNFPDDYFNHYQQQQAQLNSEFVQMQQLQQQYQKLSLSNNYGPYNNPDRYFDQQYLEECPYRTNKPQQANYYDFNENLNNKNKNNNYHGIGQIQEKSNSYFNNNYDLNCYNQNENNYNGCQKNQNDEQLVDRYSINDLSNYFDNDKLFNSNDINSLYEENEFNRLND